MKTACTCLAVAACGILGVFVLAATQRQSLTKPPPGEPAALRQPIRASEPQAPMLLDPSLKAVARASLEATPLPPREDLFVPRPAVMRMALDVLVDGRALRTVAHEGKTYLPVPCTGEEYRIRVWNHGPRRVAAIVSVDGLSVIDGKPASENSPAYLVMPYSHIVIDGWRKSMDNVAAFRFVDRDQSYASLVGKADNIGVIGLVAFEERIVQPLPKLERQGAPRAAGRFRTEVGSIGTEYGRDIDSRATYVPFLRSSHKQAITVYYDTVEALRAAGVPVDRPLPDPFPGDIKFAPPPPQARGQ